MAAVQQLAHGDILRALVIHGAAQMIDDHRHRQIQQNLFHLHQLLRRHVALDMPAQRRDAFGQRHHLVGAHWIAKPELHPHPARTGGVQTLQPRIGDRAVDNADRADILAHLSQHIQQAAIVGAIGTGLHHHVAAGTEFLLQHLVISDGDVGRRQHRLWIIGKARIVNMMMTVAGAVGHREGHLGVLGESRRGGQRHSGNNSTAVQAHHFFPV